MARKRRNESDKLKDVLWFMYDLAISLAFLGFILYLGKVVLFNMR